MKQTIEDSTPRPKGTEVGVGLIVFSTIISSIVLVILKSFSVIDMSWFLVVTSIVWIPIALVSVTVAIILIVFILMLIYVAYKRKTESEH